MAQCGCSGNGKLYEVPPVRAGVQCLDSRGEVHDAGAPFKAPDGCNDCVCTPQGAVRCTNSPTCAYSYLTFNNLKPVLREPQKLAPWSVDLSKGCGSSLNQL